MMALNQPTIHLQSASDLPAITAIGWDTEGGERAATNLLRPGAVISLRIQVQDGWIEASGLPAAVLQQDDTALTYVIRCDGGGEITWTIRQAAGGFSFEIAVSEAHRAQSIELRFPFDPRITATTVLPAQWKDDGSLRLPAIINAPDYGQMLFSADPPIVRARLLGNYAERRVDFVLDWQVADARLVRFSCTPFHLPAPEEIAAEQWRPVRRGWFGALEPLADQGEEAWCIDGRMRTVRELHPPGMLGNEVISGNATCSTWMYADHAFWLPQLADGISAMGHLRRTLDATLPDRLQPDGSLVAYWIPGEIGAYAGFLDSAPSMLISAWDYVEATGDVPWLQRTIGQLEIIGEFLARRDIDGDGLVEAVQSGNDGTLWQPARGCSWWDAINSGHKDGYCNALIYRGWRCLADLEAQLGLAEKAARYTGLADKLQAAYLDALYNPETGWLGWWRSVDGQLHDPASPLINGMAIEYGLVDAALARQILARLWAKIHAAGFTRFDLGVPSALIPFRKGEYLQGMPCGTYGIPARDDGADAFGQYMNGGIHAGQALPFLAAHYIIGDPGPADMILQAMIQRQQLGLFQNGVWGESPRGTEWTTWDGEPSGADGYLADNFRFLEAVFLREAGLRGRLYRPLQGAIFE